MDIGRQIESVFGDGSVVYQYVVRNSKLTVSLLTFGATLVSVLAPDRDGNFEEVTLGYKSTSELLENAGPYFGCIVGRYANRICEGNFVLHGQKYSLAVNNGPNSLHGGLVGFNKKNWKSQAFIKESECGVEFSYLSNDGEEGYPGNVLVTVIYTLNENQLTISYHASTDAPTPINLTNHTYWNLSGDCKRTVGTHSLSLNCDLYIPVGPSQIPTGELCAVDGTPFDLRTLSQSTPPLLEHTLQEIDGGGRPGLDHCFVVNGFPLPPNSSLVPESESHHNETTIIASSPVLRLAGKFQDPISGRTLTLHTSQPGVQIYSANWLEGVFPSPIRQHNGLCLETQHFPDSVNQPSFPSTILYPDQQWQHLSTYTFSIQ